MPATLDDIRARDGARAFRSAQVGAVNQDARTVELAFSSEAPVQRWYGTEILSHAPEAVVMTRLNDGAALLLDHDWEKQIGVVETVSIDADRRGRAVVRFGKSARAEEIFQDIADGIRRHVSVGYRIIDAERTEIKDGEDTWTITKWEPFEISIVSVPADTSVGVGRSMDIDSPAAPRAASVPEAQQQPNTRNTTDMPEAVNGGQKAATNAPAPEKTADHASTRATEVERQRVRAIMDMGEQYHAPDLARDAARDGVSVADFQRQLLDHINGRHQVPLSEQMKHADIGLTEKETRNFSFLKVVRALAEPTSRRAQEEAAFEFEASRAAAEKRARDSERFAIPADVLTRALNTAKTGAATGDTGGYLVANTLLASSFIDILRNRATIMQLGTVAGGLVGTVDIPKQVAAAQGYWVGEDQDATEQALQLGQVSLSPKTVAAYSEITRKLMMQSSIDIEALVRADLAKALALTIDKAGYYGTGSDQQPRGITNQTGINAVQFKAERPTFAELVEMETQIAVDNADVSGMAYVSEAGFRGYAKTALKHEGVAGTIWESGNTVNGYRTEITNQVNKGDVIMGNFADLLVAMWGGLDLTVDPYSNSKSGRLRIVVFQDVDFAVRRTESFCLGRKS